MDPFITAAMSGSITGDRFLVKFDVTNYTSGELIGRLSNSTDTVIFPNDAIESSHTNINEDGNYEYIVALGDSTFLHPNRFYLEVTSGGFVGTVDNFSVKKYEAVLSSAVSLDAHPHTRLIVNSTDYGDIKEEHITVIKKKPTRAPSVKIITTTDSTTNFLFEKIFPRFSCRYKYEDGEYSAFGPFTDVVFQSKYLDNYDQDNSFTTKDVYNTGAVNIIKSINLSDFIAPDMPDDVVQVDILYKQENSNVVYSIDSIKITDTAWNLPGSNQQTIYTTSKYKGSYNVTTENIYAAVPANQLLRPWDNVPKKALAQEVTGNRVVYGNYTQGYDFGISEISETPIRPDVNAGYEKRFISPDFSIGGLPSIKSLRNYQLGVIYGDKYGRETPVFTSSSGAIQLGWIDQDSDLSASQSYQLKASSTSYFPEWADYYKIFIKETSGEYYNLVMDRVYPPVRTTEEPSEHIWLSFFSTDRSKISMDDYIILKKNVGASIPQIAEDNKYKVIDVKNEAPDGVKFINLDIGTIANNSATSTGILNNGTGVAGTSAGGVFDKHAHRLKTGRRNLKINKARWINKNGAVLDDE